MRRFFDSSAPVLNPRDIVLSFTKRKPEELKLPRRAVIVFTRADFQALSVRLPGAQVDAWASFRRLYRPHGKESIIAGCHVGGPNVSALVEELAAFGATEFCLWGYCGGIDPRAVPGSIIVATAALREDGVSYHYLQGDETYVRSEWVAEWEETIRGDGLLSGMVWSTDAMYRETSDKVAACKENGVLAVEMETASFYAVCAHKRLRGVALLVVSDTLGPEGWKAWFASDELKRGAEKLATFMTSRMIV